MLVLAGWPFWGLAGFCVEGGGILSLLFIGGLKIHPVISL